MAANDERAFRGIRPGQVWRRKKDGVLATVIGSPEPSNARGQVAMQGARRFYVERQNLYRNYELVEGAP